ncbi:phosphoribosylanthranilate isomerase [Dokdonella sp.]|uniref:phosphoribosylanthranilate isomerase n=1 Tax=Dokdonella sp. TaxID=2291710 RepID=UPI003C370F5C
MNRVRIKFCGLTRLEDARIAVDLGVDALGFVFTRGSRRFVEPEVARDIVRTLPAFVTAVALFMDDEPAWVRQVISIANPSLLQFHGGESVADCSVHGKPFIKSVPMASVADVASYAAGYPGASGFLLDANRAGEPGGQGVRFDWSRRTSLQQALILAGGLDAGNVAEAMGAMHPYAVDVSSGIESAPGIKVADKMRAFVLAVRAAEID